MVEGYSHECASAGFWPGNAALTQPAFYAYAYPEPPGFRDSDSELDLEGAIFDATLGEYVLSYARVRESAAPERALLMFLQSSYNRAANLADWDRTALEREPVAP